MSSPVPGDLAVKRSGVADDVVPAAKIDVAAMGADRAEKPVLKAVGPTVTGYLAVGGAEVRVQHTVRKGKAANRRQLASVIVDQPAAAHRHRAGECARPRKAPPARTLFLERPEVLEVRVFGGGHEAACQDQRVAARPAVHALFGQVRRDGGPGVLGQGERIVPRAEQDVTDQQTGVGEAVGPVAQVEGRVLKVRGDKGHLGDGVDNRRVRLSEIEARQNPAIDHAIGPRGAADAVRQKRAVVM